MLTRLRCSCFGGLSIGLLWFLLLGSVTFFGHLDGVFGGKLRYRYMFSSFPPISDLPHPPHTPPLSPPSPGDVLMGSRSGDCGGEEELSAQHMSGPVSRMFRIIVLVEICRPPRRPHPPPPPLLWKEWCGSVE